MEYRPDDVRALIETSREAAMRLRSMMWIGLARKVEEAIARVVGCAPEAERESGDAA